jgi:hypothetical protein
MDSTKIIKSIRRKRGRPRKITFQCDRKEEHNKSPKPTTFKKYQKEKAQFFHLLDRIRSLYKLLSKKYGQDFYKTLEINDLFNIPTV